MIRSLLIFAAGILVFSFGVQRLISMRQVAMTQQATVLETRPPVSRTPVPRKPVPRTTGRVVQVTVHELNYIFSPGDLTVPVGTSVTWQNETASPHTATSVTPHLFDRPLSGYGSAAFRFTRPGIYTYYCALHPYMLGVVTVRP